MKASLTTHLRRSLSALPLLAVGLVGAAAADATPEPPMVVRVLVASVDCESTLRPAGVLGLARMPGDLAPMGRRLRCAQ